MASVPGTFGAHLGEGGKVGINAKIEMKVESSEDMISTNITVKSKSLDNMNSTAIKRGGEFSEDDNDSDTKMEGESSEDEITSATKTEGEFSKYPATTRLNISGTLSPCIAIPIPQLKLRIKEFLSSDEKSLKFPKLDVITHKRFSHFGMALNLKYKSQGSRNNKRHVLHKTDKTLPYSESLLAKVEVRLNRPFNRPFPSKKERFAKGRRTIYRQEKEQRYVEKLNMNRPMDDQLQRSDVFKKKGAKRDGF